MNRLVSQPTYTINSPIDTSYKATIMMLMDCDTRPFSLTTKLSNVQDLYNNYGALNNFKNYSIAKNLLSTGKVNIMAVNPYSSRDRRSTLSVYKYDDKIVSIHPTFSTLMKDEEIGDEYKKYRIYLDDLYKNSVFKIYINQTKSYLFAIINEDLISEYCKNLLKSDSIYDQQQVISKVFNINRYRYTEPIIVKINNSMSKDDIKYAINSNLILRSDIIFESDFTTDYYIKISSKEINEPILTNCDFGYEYNYVNNFRKGTDTLSKYNELKWYAYRLKIQDIKQNFYFKTYYNRQASILFAVINMDTLSDDDRKSYVDASKYDELIYKLFKIDRKTYTNSVVITTNNKLSDEEFKNIITKKLKANGLLYEYQSYLDEYGIPTNYLTLFSNKIRKMIDTNLYVDIDKRKSYDIDFESNYERLIFSAYTIHSNVLDNIKIKIETFGDRYYIKVFNTQGTDTVDIETFTDTNLSDLIHVLNNTSKYINIILYDNYLPVGDFNLTIDNIDTRTYDIDYYISLSKINRNFLKLSNIDIIYNTWNDINMLNYLNDIRKLNDGRILLFTDSIEEERLVNRYNFKDIECSIELLDNLDENQLLKDDKKYKKFWFIYENNIIVYGNYKIPEQYINYNLIKISPLDPDDPYDYFGNIYYRIISNYRSNMRNQLIKSIPDLFDKIILDSYINQDSSITVEDKNLKLSDKLMINKNKTLDTGSIFLINTKTNLNTEIKSYKDLYKIIQSFGINYFEYEKEIPKWDTTTELVKIQQISKECAVELCNDLNDIIISKRSYFGNYDTSYRLLMNIFSNGKYEFDLEDRVIVTELDNLNEFKQDLTKVFNSSIKGNCLQLNDLEDNTYYYSFLTPNITYRKYLVTLEECLPMILQLNHIITYVSNVAMDISNQEECLNEINKAISDVRYIIDTNTNDIELIDYKKDVHTLKLGFRMQFVNSTNKNYDFNIVINT